MGRIYGKCKAELQSGSDGSIPLDHGDGLPGGALLHRLRAGAGRLLLRAGLLHHPRKSALLFNQAVRQRRGHAGLRRPELRDPPGPPVLDRLHQAPVLPHLVHCGQLAHPVGALLRRALRGLLQAVSGPERGPRGGASQLGHGHPQHAGHAAQAVSGGRQHPSGRRAGLGHADPVDVPLHPRGGHAQRQPPAQLRHRRP